MTRLVDLAVAYGQQGFEVFPCSATNKQPLTTNGFYDATCDEQQIRKWWDHHPDALIGCRINPKHLVLDIDPRHGGDATWQALIDHYGDPGVKRQHFSGRGDGGCHVWFERPDGRLTIKAIDKFARENSTGHATGKRGWTSGIDLLHHTQRYTILPPSPHPVTGKPYQWRKGMTGEPGPLPEWLLHYLLTIPEPEAPLAQRPNLRISEGDSIADWFSGNHSWVDILTPAGWVLVDGDGDSDGSKWRHPNASAESSASVRYGCLFVYTPNTDLEQTEEGSPSGHTRFRAWAVLEHDGDLKRAARSAREMRDGPDIDLPTVRSTISTAAAPAPQAAQAIKTNLPDAFWESRPALGHIRQAAHSRARSADAVLGCVLARISAMIHPSCRLPPIVGGAVTLSIYTALVGPSGTGKSSAKSVACELLPCHNERVGDDLPVGSGEGLLEAYMGFVDEEAPDGKKRKVKRQIRDGVFAFLDEGQALSELGSRKGSTLLPTLRQMWTGGPAGTTNASIETNRQLKEGTYSIGLVIGFQPEMAAGLLGDHIGGTPQRFDWVSATDPNIPDVAPEWPGPLPWQLPAIYPNGRGTLAVADTIVATVRREALAVSRHEKVLDSLDSHSNLSRLKVAGVLALLDGRREVNEDDWNLAGIYRRHSNLVRQILLETIALSERKKEEALTARLLRREQAVAEDASKHAVEKMARSIARHVERAACAEPCTKRCMSRSTASRDRQMANVDDAIEHALSMKWIRRAGDSFRAAVDKVA
jgi:hypothetical protein